MLAGKQPRPVRFRTPLEYPSLAGKYQASINYAENTARSCLHCHQVRDAERSLVRETRGAIPDEVLFPYPDPNVLGLKMDPDELATVEAVAPGSIAARAGLRPGDAIATLDGQPLLSTADLQWVLQNAPATAHLRADVRRDGKPLNLTLDLPEGWRRQGNISWRTSTWNLRRLGLGGMSLIDLTDAERRQAGLSSDGMALLARHVAEFGEHAVAKRAGLRKGDVIVALDDQAGRLSETQLLLYTLQRKRPGDTVTFTVLRDGERKAMSFVLP
jgi:S1-C subfamily serine protease